MDKKKKRCISPYKFQRVMGMGYSCTGYRKFIFNAYSTGTIRNGFLYWKNEDSDLCYREKF